MNSNEYIESGAVEACILGLATADEIATYNMMRLQHNEVVAYANAFETKLENQLLQNVTVLPNENIKQSVLQKIATQQTTAPVVAITRPKTNFKLQYLVAACLAIAFGSILYSITMASKLKNQQAKLEALQSEKEKEDKNFAFLKNAEITPVALNGVGYHNTCKCSLFWDQSKQEVFVQVHHLMNIADTKTYQLWAVINGKNVSLGTFVLTADKSPIKLGKVPNGVTAFMVTLEDKGGAIIPNSDIILKGIVSI